MSELTNAQQDWVSLMEYAMNHGVSLSTLRRHIKANKIPYKLENGRYLLRAEHARSARASFESAGAIAAPPQTLPSGELHAQLQKAREEIAELKMLVAIYEEQLGLQPTRQGKTHFDV